MSQKLRVEKSKNSESKCIYCHELVGPDSLPYKTCESCFASVHDDCDSTGRCLIPGCGQALAGAPSKTKAKAQTATPSFGKKGKREVSQPARRLNPVLKRVLILFAFLALVAGFLYLSWHYPWMKKRTPEEEDRLLLYFSIGLTVSAMIAGVAKGVYDDWRNKS